MTGVKLTDDPGSQRVYRRILRDDDDASGQSVRSWEITVSDGSFVQIARNEHADWVSLRVADLPRLIADLQEIYDRAALSRPDRAGGVDV